MSTYEVSKSSSPLGELEIAASLRGLARVRYVTWPVRVSKRPVFKQASIYAEEARVQLQEYFAGKRRIFNVPLDLSLTDRKKPSTLFQQKVWVALLRIPFGHYRTYGEVARMVGRPGGAQAVGQAVKQNPIPVIVPCHRVIPTQAVAAGANPQDGSLLIGGYNGGIKRKNWLLSHEYRLLTGAPRRIPVVVS
ncbi:MAG: methylated-DNA--[protein]-cysteine S-methyltransferase [Candidatus Andersenbacteria bacterium]